MYERGHVAVNPTLVRKIVRAFLIILAVSLAVPVFGLCIPFTLLALRVLPSMGVGGAVYVIAGAIVGLVVGLVGATSTLRGPTLWTRRYVAFVAALALVLAVAGVAARWFDAFAHV